MLFWSTEFIYFVISMLHHSKFDLSVVGSLYILHRTSVVLLQCQTSQIFCWYSMTVIVSFQMNNKVNIYFSLKTLYLKCCPVLELTVLIFFCKIIGNDFSLTPLSFDNLIKGIASFWKFDIKISNIHQILFYHDIYDVILSFYLQHSHSHREYSLVWEDVTLLWS